MLKVEFTRDPSGANLDRAKTKEHWIAEIKLEWWKHRHKREL